jgi:hypothetical protein
MHVERCGCFRHVYTYRVEGAVAGDCTLSDDSDEITASRIQREHGKQK